MRNWIACILLSIFTFQVLPVRELGRILFKGLMTEEIHEADHADDGFAKLKKAEPKIFFSSKPVSCQQYVAARVQTAIHEAERLPIDFVPEILTPPPNAA